MARAALAAPAGLDPLTTTRPVAVASLRRDLAWWQLGVFALMVVVGVIALLLQWQAFIIGIVVLQAPQAAASFRTIRHGPPTVAVDDATCTIVDRGTFGATPLGLRRDELHSIVPVWLRSAQRTWGRPSVPVVRSKHVPMVGQPRARRGPALVFVLREERRWASNRPPLRGVIVAVDDLDAAQRVVQPWGLLARLTPGAFEWLLPTSTATSPGPLPVYGT